MKREIARTLRAVLLVWNVENGYQKKQPVRFARVVYVPCEPEVKAMRIFRIATMSNAGGKICGEVENMKIRWKILWSAFRNMLICIGGLAIPAYLANLSLLPMLFSLAWLSLILLILYSLEIGQARKWQTSWN